MAEKFANKYRISSARLENWDYRLHSAYFVTINTKDRKNYFGRVANGKMILSGVGIIADILWHDMVRHSKTGKPDTFMVMPDHIHGIVIISNDDVTVPGGQNPDQGIAGGDRGVVGSDIVDWNAVETLHATSQQPCDPSPCDPKTRQLMAGISPKPGSLSAIIRSYKSAVTRHANRLGFPFAWQPRFHDHIIRNENAYLRIHHYILNNPKNWNHDK
jgi:REP element-mobilizing transposase RayT